MAEKNLDNSNNKKQYEVDLEERLWIQQALQLQRDSLTRKRGQERAGSEIHDLRGREIDAVDRLKNKFA